MVKTSFSRSKCKLAKSNRVLLIASLTVQTSVCWKCDATLANPSVTGDFSGDGLQDIVSTGYVRFGNGDGTFADRVSANTGIPCSSADFNSDGIDELLSRLNRVYLGSSDGSLTLSQSFPVLGEHSTSGDIDGDDILDLVGSIGRFALGRGDGTFDLIPGNSITDEAADVSIAEFDGDEDELDNVA